MKRLGLVLVALALSGAALTAAHAASDANRFICHRTSSKTTPYVKLSVSAKQLRTHLTHPDDIFPVHMGGCPRTVLTSTSGGTAFQVALTGEAESPAGDPVATGVFQ